MRRHHGGLRAAPSAPPPASPLRKIRLRDLTDDRQRRAATASDADLHTVTSRDLLDWIKHGPAGTPRTPRVGDAANFRKPLPSQALRSNMLRGSTSPTPGRRALRPSAEQLGASPSLPAIPTWQAPSTAPSAACAGAASAPTDDAPPGRRCSTRKPLSSSQSLVGVSAGAAAAAAADALGFDDPGRMIKSRHAMRAARQAHAATATGIGLDSTSTWRYAGKLASSADLQHVARRALARRQALADAITRSLELERVDTPQHAARRDLPPPSRLPEMPSQEVADEATLQLRYWTPPSALEKMPHYVFHEPGPRVRESLLVLEELRGKGGRGRRLRLEARHREETARARERAAMMVRDHDIDQEAGRAASTVQRAWRGRGGAGGSTPSEA